jgi:S1-C subfamily serine protease
MKVQHRNTDIDQLQNYTVRIKTEVSVGTEVIVTESGLILTCYHVIGDVKNTSTIFEDIEIYLPEADNTLP